MANDVELTYRFVIEISEPEIRRWCVGTGCPVDELAGDLEEALNDDDRVNWLDGRVRFVGAR